MDTLLTFGDQLAREKAEWYPTYGDFDHYKCIAVQNMNETRDNYGRIGENFQADSKTLTLRTRYQYDFAPPKDGDKIQHILYRGQWYEITEVRPHELGGFGLYRYREYYLILIEVAYGRDYA